MKKIAAIVLLMILLFNWVGYRLVLSIMENKTNKQMEAQLDDNNYDDAQLISIKTPVKYLTYYNSSKVFERVDGQVEMNGIPYKYVKRRIYDDSIEYLCIPDHAAMKWQNVKQEFLRFSMDMQQEKKQSSHPLVSKGFSPDYFTLNDLLEVSPPFFTCYKTNSPYFFTISSAHCPVVEQPPERCRVS